MRRVCLVLALGILLLTDALALRSAWQNRAGTAAATIELTERELWLEEMDEENGARFLQLEWRGTARRLGHKYEDGAGWFDAAKLRELGYPIDPRPLDEDSAPRVAALPTMEAFAVMEFDQEGKQQQPSTNAAFRGRLTVVDTGRNASTLRGKYPDVSRYLLLRCLVLPMVERRYEEATRTYKPGYVRGAIVSLTGSRIYVPPAQGRLLRQLGRKSSREYFSSPQDAVLPPRYSAIMAIGSRYEPWLISVRLLEGK